MRLNCACNVVLLRYLRLKCSATAQAKRTKSDSIALCCVDLLSVYCSHQCNNVDAHPMLGEKPLMQTTLCLKKGYHPTTNDNFNNTIPVIFCTNVAD